MVTSSFSTTKLCQRKNLLNHFLPFKLSMIIENKCKKKDKIMSQHFTINLPMKMNGIIPNRCRIMKFLIKLCKNNKKLNLFPKTKFFSKRSTYLFRIVLNLTVKKLITTILFITKHLDRKMSSLIIYLMRLLNIFQFRE